MGSCKLLKKQQGGIKSWMLFILIIGAGYSTYHFDQQQALPGNKIAGFFSTAKAKLADMAPTFNGFRGYGVQVMATEQLSHATRVMEDFARDGYSAFVLSSKKHGRTLYKVRLGPYAEKPEANAIKDKVKQRYPNSPYLTSSFVIYRP